MYGQRRTEGRMGGSGQSQQEHELSTTQYCITIWRERYLEVIKQQGLLYQNVTGNAA